MNLKELSVKYDRIYEEADELFKKHNPCQFEGSRCIMDRTAGDSENGCCYRLCPNFGPSGCKARSLGCKLFTCKSFSEEDFEFSLKISKLRREAAGICSGFVCIVTTKEDILKIYGRPRK